MTTTEAALEQDWATWHAEREELLRAPHGWLSLTGLYWLDTAAAAVGDLPGTWRATGDGGVEITAAAGDGVVVGDPGETVDGTARLDPTDGAPGELVTVGERKVEVLRREHHVALRVRDPQAPTRRRFDGVPTFDVDASWIVDAVFTPWERPERIDVDTVIDGLGYHPTAVGTVRFVLGGAPQELTALSAPDGEIKLHFRDATSGTSTYGGGRSVTTTAPDADGRVRVDLNRTVNLPCAFSEHATCPLPPAGNVVTVPVEAGEKTPC